MSKDGSRGILNRHETGMAQETLAQYEQGWLKITLAAWKQRMAQTQTRYVYERATNPKDIYRDKFVSTNPADQSTFD